MDSNELSPAPSRANRHLKTFGGHCKPWLQCHLTVLRIFEHVIRDTLFCRVGNQPSLQLGHCFIALLP